MPPPVAARLDRCVEAPLDEHVASGRIRSAELLAHVSPRLTSGVRAASIVDPALRALRARVDYAFRRRRGLLLVDLQHQVRIEELPWVAALKPFEQAIGAAGAARAALESLVLLALDGFPATQFPNPMVSELRTLAQAANVPVPLTEELAADIFQGTFTKKFANAALLSCAALQGSVYATYFDLPAHVRVEPTAHAQRPYAELCERRVPPAAPRAVTADELRTLVARASSARTRSWSYLDHLDPQLDRVVPGLPAPGRTAGLDEQVALDVRRLYFAAQRSVARNGAIIEQSLVLTTHGVVPLIEALDLHERLQPLLPSMCDRTLAFITQRFRTLGRLSGVRQLRAIKDAAYAWRQLVLWISLDLRGPHPFLKRADAAPAGRAFEPVWEGLVRAAAGERFDADGTLGSARRFYGWSPSGPHWLADALSTEKDDRC